MSQNGAFYQALAFDFCPTAVPKSRFILIKSGPKSSLKTNRVATNDSNLPKANKNCSKLSKMTKTKK